MTLRHRISRWAITSLAMLALAACGGDHSTSHQKTADRIVVMNSYVAEIVVALGDAAQIVATTGGVDHIPELADVPGLPGYRQTSAESVLAFRPQTVISTDNILDADVAGQLRAAGVNVVLLADDPSIAGVDARIQTVAALLGKQRRGERLSAEFHNDLTAAQAEVARLRGHRARPRGLFILSGGGRPTLVAGAGTGPATLIELAGGRNVATGFEGFKIMSQEAMIEAAPDFILVNENGMDLKDGVPVALSAPGARMTPAGQNNHLVTLVGGYLNGFGLRTPDAIRLLAAAIYMPADKSSEP